MMKFGHQVLFPNLVILVFALQLCKTDQRRLRTNNYKVFHDDLNRKIELSRERQEIRYNRHNILDRELVTRIALFSRNVHTNLDVRERSISDVRILREPQAIAKSWHRLPTRYESVAIRRNERDPQQKFRKFNLNTINRFQNIIRDERFTMEQQSRNSGRIDVSQRDRRMTRNISENRSIRLGTKNNKQVIFGLLDNMRLFRNKENLKPSRNNHKDNRTVNDASNINLETPKIAVCKRSEIFATKSKSTARTYFCRKSERSRCNLKQIDETILLKNGIRRNTEEQKKNFKQTVRIEFARSSESQSRKISLISRRELKILNRITNQRRELTVFFTERNVITHQKHRVIQNRIRSVERSSSAYMLSDRLYTMRIKQQKLDEYKSRLNTAIDTGLKMDKISNVARQIGARESRDSSENHSVSRRFNRRMEIDTRLKMAKISNDAREINLRYSSLQRHSERQRRITIDNSLKMVIIGNDARVNSFRDSSERNSERQNYNRRINIYTGLMTGNGNDARVNSFRDSLERNSERQNYNRRMNINTGLMNRNGNDARVNSFRDSPERHSERQNYNSRMAIYTGLMTRNGNDARVNSFRVSSERLPERQYNRRMNINTELKMVGIGNDVRVKNFIVSLERHSERKQYNRQMNIDSELDFAGIGNEAQVTKLKTSLKRHSERQWYNRRSTIDAGLLSTRFILKDATLFRDSSQLSYDKRQCNKRAATDITLSRILTISEPPIYLRQGNREIARHNKHQEIISNRRDLNPSSVEYFRKFPGNFDWKFLTTKSDTERKGLNRQMAMIKNIPNSNLAKSERSEMRASLPTLVTEKIFKHMDRLKSTDGQTVYRDTRREELFETNRRLNRNHRLKTISTPFDTLQVETGDWLSNQMLETAKSIQSWLEDLSLKRNKLVSFVFNTILGLVIIAITSDDMDKGVFTRFRMNIMDKVRP